MQLAKRIECFVVESDGFTKLRQRGKAEAGINEATVSEWRWHVKSSVGKSAVIDSAGRAVLSKTGAVMPMRSSARIHATAIVSAEADLADDVEVGPFVVIEGPVRLGPGCVVRPYVHLVGPLTMGRGNMIYSGAVLGERPQHTRYNNEPTCVEIGDDNIFREHVTVHRGTTHSMKTVIGNHNYLMAGCHVAHDCVVGNRCILTNGCLVAGHCIIEDNVILSGNSALQQFCRVGRLAFLSGVSASTKDVPPFVIHQGIDTVSGVNLIGMKRAGMTAEEINAAFKAAAW